MHYEPVKVTINTSRLAEIILDVMVQYHGLSDSIITNRSSLFTLKFLSSLCYFFRIKWRLSTAFYFQTNGQTKCQNNTIEVYLRAFINIEQNNLAKVLPIAEFFHTNTKNLSTSYMPFKLNYSYHSQMLNNARSQPPFQI